jgi:hypothetical protein
MEWLNAMSLGRQHRMQDDALSRQNRLGQLAGQALSAPLAERGQFASQIAEVDPDAGFAFSQNVERQQAADEEGRNAKLVNMAKLLSVAPEQARGGLYARMAPGLREMGLDAPEAWSDDLMPVVQQLAGAGQQQASLTPSMQSLIWQRDNKIIGEDEFRQAVRILNRQDAAAQNQQYSPQRIEQADGTFRIDLVPTRGGNVAGAAPAFSASGYAPQAPAPQGQPREITFDPTGLDAGSIQAARQQMEAEMGSPIPDADWQRALQRGSASRFMANRGGSLPGGGVPQSEMDRRTNATLNLQTFGSPDGQATNASRAAAKAEEAGLVREQEDLSRMGTERLGEIRAAARVASTEMASLTELERLLSQVNTGAFAETRINLGRAASFLGLSDGAEVSAAEAAASIANRLALALRNPAGGEGMPGAMSDADREFLRSTIPSIQNSPDGWRQMIEIRRRLAAASQEQAEEAERFMRDGGRSRDLPGHMAEWSRQRRLFADMEARGGSAASAEDEALINRYLQGQ